MRLFWRIAPAGAALLLSVPGICAAGMTVEKACSPDETWSSVGGVKPPVARLFDRGIPGSEEDALARFKEAYLVQADKKLDQESKIAAQYWMWRSLLSMRLEILAQPAFVQLIGKATSPALRMVRFAAIACVAGIAEKYPALRVPKAEQEAVLAFPLQGLTDEQRRLLMKTRFAILKAQIGEESSDPTRIVESLRGEESLYSFARGLAMLRISPKDAIAPLEKFIKLESGEWLRNHVDFVRLTLGRLHYQQGDYASSIRHFDGVTSSSPWFAQAIAERAWSYLMKKDYEKALGTAYTAETTGLRNSFLPGTALVAGIAYFETCNFSEAVQSTQLLQARYHEAYNWLSRNAEKPMDYYGAAMESVKGKGGVPKLVATAWLGSSAFVAVQSQINRLLEEGDLSARVQAQVVKQARDPALNYLSKLLGYHAKGLAASEKRFIGKINGKLGELSATMLAQLEEMAQKGQLLEAEIFSAATGKMVQSRAPAAVRPELERARAAAKKLDGKRVWVWGNVSTDQVSQSESWQDEVGLFRAQLTDRCGEK